jgi:hypothetical protein
MKTYLARVSHFSFYKEGDELVVECEECKEFEERFAWEERLEEYDGEELTRELYATYYTELVKRYI